MHGQAATQSPGSLPFDMTVQPKDSAAEEHLVKAMKAGLEVQCAFQKSGGKVFRAVADTLKLTSMGTAENAPESPGK
jgi:hypothetical protein